MTANHSDDVTTGASSLIRSLEEVGRTPCPESPEAPSARLRPARMDSTKLRHIPVRHEQGAGHAAEGARGRQRSGRRLHGDVRAWRDESGHPLADACYGTRSPSWRSPDRCHHWRSAPMPSKRPTSGGITMPITKHNFWSPIRRRSRAIREVPYRLAPAGPVPSWSTSARTLRRTDHVPLVRRDGVARLPAEHPAAFRSRFAKRPR